MILPVLVIAAAAPGDVIVTNDGQRLEGEIRRVSEGWRVTQRDGTTVIIPGTKIRSIELSNSQGSSPGRSFEGLQSLRRSVEHSDDVHRIIDRYATFIEQTKDEAVRAEAKKDLAVWLDRRDRKLIKVGRRWVTAAEQREIAMANFQKIDDARQFIKAGQTKEAEKLLAGLLTDEPSNVSALYLSGVLRAREGNYPEAKKHFQAVQQAIGNHPPTLLNLAVIFLKQKQWGPAASSMEQALAAAPNVQFLIDQAAELFHLLPEDQQKTPAAQKLSRRFAEQDTRLQDVMARREMYRWGATWVDKATYDKLLSVEAEVKKKLADYQNDFDLTQNRIAAIDQQIADNQRAMREIEQRSYARGIDGTLIRIPYPAAYYDMQREIARLRGERQEMVARLDTLRTAARKVQAEYPVPKYTGVVRMIEEDGVPVVMPDALPAGAPPTAVPPTAPAPSGSTTRPPPTAPATLPTPATQPADAPEPPPPFIRIGPGPDADQVQ